jgi:hypothetical protein
MTIGTGPGPVDIDGVGANHVCFTFPYGIALDSSTGILYLEIPSYFSVRPFIHLDSNYIHSTFKDIFHSKIT